MAINDQLAALFLAESSDLLVVASNCLLEAEATGHCDEAIDQLFRTFHSIKGGAMSLDYCDLAEIAHRLEDLLDLARQGRLSIDETITSLIFQSIDWMDRQMRALAGNQPVQDAAEKIRLDLLTTITQIIDELGPAQPMEQAVSLPVSNIKIDPNKALVYCEGSIAASSPMPAVTMMIMMQRLEEIGEIVFSNPSQPEIMNGSISQQVLHILITTNDDDEALKKAMMVPDVTSIRTCAVSGQEEREPLALWPTPEAMSEFQQLVAQMAEELEVKELPDIQAFAEKLSDWAATGEVDSWYPGGETGWKRITGMLWLCAECLSDSRGAGVKQRVQEGLTGIWQGVFNALDCHKYYCLLKLNKDDRLRASHIVSQAMAKPDMRLVIIDLTLATTMEYQDVQELIDIRRQLAEQGLMLALVGDGPAGRSHQNVLESVLPLTGGLAVWPNAYEACWRAALEKQVKRNLL
jgi:HPt (histidine-containing phosphotransfer) domain-containing protein